MDATDLCFAGAAEQARLVAAGEVSSRELIEAALERIWQADPEVNAFRVVLAHRALTEADQADARRGAGDRRPLLGVPVAIKDDTDVAGEVTAWGSLSHGGPRERDADVVRALREAGAVVLGKTHVPELTIFPFTESLAFGATRNPWSLDHTPG
ncbi:MAG TPA: amidase family protein, partial [Solirubrobacteraceae bacterium]